MQKRARHPQKFMSSSQQKSVPRAVIEHMVREQVYQEMGIDLPAQAKAPKGFVVNISARHCHLTQEAVEALFGPVTNSPLTNGSIKKAPTLPKSP